MYTRASHYSCKMSRLAFLKLHASAVIPQRATLDAAGYDLSSKDNGENVVVPAKGKALVKTGLRSFIPEGCYGRIAARSGISWKNHIDVGAGVIDRDYKGEIGIVLFNHASEDFVISPGQRIAQFVLEMCKTPCVYEATIDPQTGKILYKMVDNVYREAIRGEGGFGSTGIQNRNKNPTVGQQQQQQQQQLVRNDNRSVEDDGTAGKSVDFNLLEDISDNEFEAQANGSDVNTQECLSSFIVSVKRCPPPSESFSLSFSSINEKERELTLKSFPGKFCQRRKRRHGSPPMKRRPSFFRSRNYRYSPKLNKEWNCTLEWMSNMHRQMKNYFSDSRHQK